MILSLIITLSVVVAVYVGYLVLDAVWLKPRRIRRRTGALQGESGSSGQPTGPTGPEDHFPTISRVMSSRGVTDGLFMMLLRAGIKLRPSEFIGIVASLAIGLSLVAAALLDSVTSVIAAMAVGVGVPFIYVRVLQARRLAAFDRQLPDALSLIGSGIRSGYSFHRSIQMVADEMPAPISEECGRVLNEVAVGLALDAALMRMSMRVRSYDFELVVTAVAIQQQVGGNLAEIMDNIAETIRARVRVEGELAALTADGRLSGAVLLMLPVFLAGVILVMNPGYLRPLITEPVGRLMLGGSILLQVVGAVVIKRMVTLDY
jgi:tight adherence protein B